MQRGAAARSIGQAKVSDLAGGPLGTVVDLATQYDACADIRADMDQDECFLCLRGTAVALALRGEVGIVLNDDQAVDDFAQLGTQWNGTPVFQGADGQHDALIHIGDGRHTHHHGEQLLALLPVLAQQAPYFLADKDANGVWGCFPVGKRYFVGIEFAAVQIGEQER